MAVVVVVRDRDAHIVAEASQARGIGHVGKHAVAVVAEQAVAVSRRLLFQGGDIGAVGKENVGTSVAVVIEDGHSAGHGFGSVLCGRLAVLQAEGDFLQFEPDGTGRLGPMWPKQTAHCTLPPRRVSTRTYSSAKRQGGRSHPVVDCNSASLRSSTSLRT